MRVSTRRPIYAIVCARTGDELAARYRDHSHAEERCHEVRYWHPAAEVVEAPPRLPRRGGR